MNNIEIIRATVLHAQQIAEIEQQCFSVPWSQKSVAEFLENPLSVCFVAVTDEKTVGYIGMYCVCGNGDITNVAVLNEYRRCGIARKLLCSMEQYSLSCGISEISLEVRASNTPALNLYSNSGFESVGTRKNYYTKPKEDAVLMTKYLSSAQ